MPPAADFASRLEAKISEQLGAQRVGFLLGAGSSFLDGAGYPIASALWESIRYRIADSDISGDIQKKLDDGADGLEQALDLLDNGQAIETPHRHLVTDAIAELFAQMTPPLETHVEFVQHLSVRSGGPVKLFSLNYDPLIERAAEQAKVRLYDGFCGHEHAFFDSSVFEEQIGRIGGSFRGRTFRVTAKPLLLLKLHGSLGWYQSNSSEFRRCAFCAGIAPPYERLMIPPQQRKATDTMREPYAQLWSVFRGCLAQNSSPISRLACIGYGFRDEHVNAVIENALARPDFTLLIFAKDLTDTAWNRWNPRSNVVIVTQSRCSLKGEGGPGHADLWSFERVSKEV